MKENNRLLITVIDKDSVKLDYWKDIWGYRELLLILSWRDFKVRYKQTFFGVAWALLRPILVLLTFTIVFGRIAKLPSEGEMPYILLVLAGLLPWQFFSSAVSACSESLIGNESLVSKVYLPRIIIPLSTIFTILVDFGLSLLLLFVLVVYLGYPVSLRLCIIPVFLLLVFILSFGIGLFFAALNVQYRDVRYALPFVLQAGLFLSPIGYSSSVIPDPWDQLYLLNPMVGIIDGFRWCLSENDFPSISIGFSLITSFILLVLGLRYFRNMENQFADLI